MRDAITWPVMPSRSVLVALALCLLPAAASAQDSTRPPVRCRARGADLILYNGRVETLDRRFSRGDAIAVLRGRVVWVGSTRATLSLFRGCSTKLVDLKGKAVLPGFVDAHTHAFQSIWWTPEDPADDAEAMARLETVQDAQLAVGITTQAEALANPILIPPLHGLDAAGKPYIRTSLYLRRTGNCIDIFDDPDGYSPLNDVTAIPRIPGIKIFADGAGNNPCGYKPATTFEHVGHDPAPFFGDLLFDQATMDTLVQNADAGGWQILVHSIGDRSRDEVLGSYSTILAGDGANPLRHRIEHNNYIRPDQIALYVKYGVLPVVFGYQFTCDINAGLNTLLESATDKSWYQPYRTMFAAGLRVAWHGDWTAAEVTSDPPDSLETWMGGILSSLVTRKEFRPGEICEPQPWSAAETVTIKQAMRMISRNSSFAIGMEDVVGSLEPGKLADMVIVSEDPLTADPDDLHDMRVLVTIVGGVPRYCSASAGSLCF